MISIETVVTVILFLIGCAAVFGLLFFLINYCEKEFPAGGIFFKFARIFLVILAVLVLIGLILQLMGHPLIVLH